MELGQLKEPYKLIFNFAHEIAHIKILGEGRLKENDEYLTDLVTVFWGLGIFNANSAVKFYADAAKWAIANKGICRSIYTTRKKTGLDKISYS